MSGKEEEEEEALLKECAGDVDNDGDVVVSSVVLGFRLLNEHLRYGLEDLHLVEDGGAVIGDDDLGGGGRDNCVYIFGGYWIAHV